MRALIALFLLGAPLFAQTFPPVVHYVVPQGYERTLGDTREMFPLDYSNYVRYQLAIDRAAMPAPGPITGLAFRAASWPLLAGPYWVDLRILAGHTKLHVHQLGSTYDQNFSDQPVEVFRGRLHVAVPPPNAELGPFDAKILFNKFFIYSGVDHFLLDLVPLEHSVFGICGGGGAGRGYDAIRTHPQLGHVMGKGACGIPTTGGSASAGGYIVELWLAGGVQHSGGCTYAGATPEAAFNGIPFTGNNFAFELNQAPVGSLPILMLGFNDSSWAGIPLPWNMSGLGLTGCRLAVQPLAFLGAPLTGTQPDRAWAYLPGRIPADPLLVGAPIAFQWLLPVAGANPAGLILSDGARVSVR